MTYSLVMTTEERNMITDTIRTGNKRSVERKLSAIDAGYAEALGRPAEAHLLVEMQEEIEETHHKGLGAQSTTRWVTVRQERRPL